MVKYSKRLLGLFLLSCSYFSNTISALPDTKDNASAIEHRGDRYIINVQDMELNGEESLMDILQICPEFTMTDYDHLLEDYSFRVGNVPIRLDTRVFLANCRAADVESVHICNFTNVVKGTDGTKGVIDIYLVNKDDRTDGHVALEYRMDGRAAISLNLIHQKKNLTWWLNGQSKCSDTYHDYRFTGLDNEIYEFTLWNREHIEHTNMGLTWNMSPKDMLVLNVNQHWGKEHTEKSDDTHGTSDHLLLRFLNGTLDYIHMFNEKGLTLTCEAAYNYSNTSDNSLIPVYETTSLFNKDKTRTPYVYLQLDAPLLNNHLIWNIGTEVGFKKSEKAGRFYFEDIMSVRLPNGSTGYIAVDDNTLFDCNHDYSYRDAYTQLNFKFGHLGISAGDRYRWLDYSDKDTRIDTKWTGSRGTNTYMGSIFWDFDRSNHIQLSHSKRLMTPQLTDLTALDANIGLETDPATMKRVPKIQNFSWRENTSMSNFSLPETNCTELSYTYQGENLNFMMKGVRQNSKEGYNKDYGTDKLGETEFKATVYYHDGGLHLTAGGSYDIVKRENSRFTSQSHSTDFRVSGMYNHKNSWIAQGLFEYNSGINLANFYDYSISYYGSARFSKFFTIFRSYRIKTYAEYHATVNRHSNRALTLGVSYEF